MSDIFHDRREDLKPDYRGQHQASMGPPIHNLLEPEPGSKEGIAPPDIYTHMHYYGDGEAKWDSESQSAIHAARGDRPLHQRPATDNSRFGIPDFGPESDESFSQRQQKRQQGEHKVTVYRAAPKGIPVINTGDWVTPSRSYALQHAKHPTDKTKDWPVYKAQVPAKHVRWAGDSLNEFGYSGPPIKPNVHNRGGKNAEPWKG